MGEAGMVLFSGPGHVIECDNEAHRAMIPSPLPYGCPVREAFPEVAYIPLQQAMDRV